MTDPLEFEARADGHPPLVEGHEPEARHRVKAHERRLKPKIPKSDPDQIYLDLGDPVAEPQPRKVPVRPHVRRNPRRQKEPQMTTPISDTDAEAIEVEIPRRPDPPLGDFLSPPTQGSTAFPEIPGGMAHARSTDPQTSHDAAAQVVTKPSQVAVLRIFRGREDRASGGTLLPSRVSLDLADFEVERYVEASAFSPSRLRSARHELTVAGFIEPTGEQRKTPYGRMADVHRLTPNGRSVALPPLAERTD